MEGVPQGFYQRTMKYLQERKLRVNNKSVLLGGVGTLGSRILRNLARFNFKKIFIIDFDTVGPENVGYQCYHSDEIGEAKVESIAERFQELHPWTQIEPLNFEVPTPSTFWNDESFNKLSEIAKEVDIIITSFDVIPPRAVLLLLAVYNSKKFVDVGIGSTRGYIKVLKDNFCPICDKVWTEKVTYYTNPNLAEMVSAVASQAVLHLLNDIAWPSLINIYMEDPINPYMASEVVTGTCPLCDRGEVSKLKGARDFLEYLLKNIY